MEFFKGVGVALAISISGWVALYHLADELTDLDPERFVIVGFVMLSGCLTSFIVGMVTND